jgi:excinuclease UvrABC helicase subunit UvrB
VKGIDDLLAAVYGDQADGQADGHTGGHTSGDTNAAALSVDALKKQLAAAQAAMLSAAADLEFEQAAKWRDDIKRLEGMLLVG